MKPLTLHDYLEIALRRKWWIIIPLILSISGASFLADVLPKSYRSSTLILVEPQKVPEEYVKAAVTGSIEDRLSTIRQQVLSRSLLQRVIDEFHLSPESDLQRVLEAIHLLSKKEGPVSSEDVVNVMRNRITIETVSGKNIDAFTISYEGDDPESTMNVTNKLASLFIEENLKIREQLVEGTSDFLETQLKSIKAQLEAQEQKISAYKQRYMGSLPSQLDTNLRTLDRLQLQLQSITGSIRDAEDRKNTLNQLLALGGETTQGAPLQDPRLGHLQALKKRLIELEAEYTESYPDVVMTKQEIARLEREIRSSNAESSAGDSGNQLSETAALDPSAQLDKEIARLKSQQQNLLKEIAEYEKRVEETPKREEELANLTRDYTITQKSYDTLLSKAGDAKVSENLEKRQKGEQFRIIDSANYPQRPFKPNLFKLLAMGLVIGLGCGGGLAFFLENMDTSIKKADELEEAFGHPVLSVIPRAEILQKVGTLQHTAIELKQQTPDG
jgi:succinoglycan biosynthesis transport protein ExoP